MARTGFWVVLAVFVLISAADAPAQTAASYGQQIAVAKTIVQDLKSIGVLTATLSDKDLENINRAALGQGVKLFVGRVKDPSLIATLYKTLVNDKGSQIIWVPTNDEDLLQNMGFKYLRESSVRDRVGLLVPNNELVPSGALCSVATEGGKVKAYVNQRIAEAVGASIPTGEGPITFVVR